MTRILRLLLIAAVAWPMWQPIAAQEVVQKQSTDQILQKESVEKNLLPVSKAKQMKLNAQDVQQKDESIVLDNSNIVKPKKASSNNVTGKGLRDVGDEDITVANGTNTGKVPFYTYYLEQSNHGQIIYLASDLNLTPGSKIKAITFYTNNNLTSYSGSRDNTVTLKLGETDKATFSNTTFEQGLTTVATMTSTQILNGTQSVTFAFNTEYTYQGGNLVVDASCGSQSSGMWTNSSVLWYGLNSSGSSLLSYGSYSTSQQNFKPKMTLRVEMAASNLLDFGVVEVSNSKTLSATVINPGNAAVTANLTTAAPFSVANTSITMNPGTNVIPVTFTPTDARVYNGTLKVVMNGETTTVTLKGVGNATGSPAALRDSTFFAGITYEWTDSLNNTHNSRLDQIATDPDQMIAMLTEVYTNKEIPGNFKRGYSETLGSEPYDDVAYTGVGTISHDGSNTYNSASHYSWTQKYGWDIPGTIKYGYDSDWRAHYAYMDSTQYKPNYNGLTLLLVEMKDDYKLSEYVAYINSKTYDTYYDKLRDQFLNSVKSIRVISEAKRTGTGEASGTLFKIDCDKMNKFFLIAKGQLRYRFNSQRVFSDDEHYYPTATFCRLPLYAKSDYTNVYYLGDENNTTGGFMDYNCGATLYHMFEQFSPYDLESQGDNDDLYQSLIKMESFGVKHDCVAVPTATPSGHQFMMYGEDSGAADCQDVRDLMFFIPDYRMKYHANRSDFLNYNPSHMPTMGLFVIRQDSIQGEPVSGKDMYKLTLTWDSNLDEFLPSDQQVYQLLQVVLREDGTEEYVPVYYKNSDGQYTNKEGTQVVTTPVPIELTFNPGVDKTYTDVYVPMQETSYQLTYAIRGQDITKFFDLKVSNKRDYIIPGLDANEMIKLTDATHYSRFNPQTVVNCYSNKLQMTNNAIGINNKIIVDGENGTKLDVIRTHVETVNGTSTNVDETVATITFNNHASSDRSWTVTMNMATQSDKTKFPAGQSNVEAGNVEYYAGYHANQGNSWTKNYSISSNGNIILSPAIVIYDNFVVDVSENTHPSGYTYKLKTNYPGAVYLNTNNNGTDYTNDAVWYAWTWNTAGVDEEWIEGRSTNKTGQYMFTPLKNNFIFVRMNPSGAPDWSAKWNQTGDLTAQGDTYTITGWGSQDMTGTWSGSNDATAYSNDFRIPVYKANSKINSTFTKDSVDNDLTGYMNIDENLTFGVNVQYSSKTEILRYDAYRWGETEDRYIVDEVRNYDDEDDIAPTGVAGNQDGSYTVSMNEVGTANYYTSSVSVGSGENDKWAEFVDYVPSDTTVGAAYTYAPVVELFTFGKDVNNKEREDYNTYGGPLQTAAMGKLDFSIVEPDGDPRNAQMSDYFWDDENGNKYAYYNFRLNVDTKSVPPGYNIYKIRAWREVDTDLLGEQYEDCEGRISSPYKFEDITYPDYDKNDSYVLGSKEVPVEAEGHANAIDSWRGTFGARKVRTEKGETGVIEELPICFYVRIYFTRSSNLPQNQSDVMPAPRQIREGEVQEPVLDADGKYYVAEKIIDYVFEGSEEGIPTGVQNLNVREVVGVKYYNPAGIESDTPFDGVNIVVTRYSDGSTTTTKILK